MKRVLCLLFLSGLVATGPAALAAEENGFYAGAGIGSVNLEEEGASFRNSAGVIMPNTVLKPDFDRVVPLRLSGGYNWGGWALELAYEVSVTDADFRLGNVSGTYDYSSFSIAGVYRSSGQLYFLGKLGASQPDFDSNSAGLKLKAGTKGIYGAGLGYRFTDSTALEFDFTRDGDKTSTFMLGLRIHF